MHSSTSVQCALTPPDRLHVYRSRTKVTGSASAINTASDIDSESDEAMSADRRECAAVRKARGKCTRRDNARSEEKHEFIGDGGVID